MKCVPKRGIWLAKAAVRLRTPLESGSRSYAVGVLGLGAIHFIVDYLSDLQPTHTSHFPISHQGLPCFILIPFTDHLTFDIPSADLRKMGIVASFFKQSFFLPAPTFTEKNLPNQAGKVRIGHLTWFLAFLYAPATTDYAIYQSDPRRTDSLNNRSSLLLAQTLALENSLPRFSTQPMPPSMLQRAPNPKRHPPSNPSDPPTPPRRAPSISSNLTSQTSPPSKPPPKSS